jgi:MYXO-CTERM domain-containing protein
VELHRQAGDGAFVRLFHGPLGEAALECPCPPEDQPRCCLRRCRTFVDVCPAPDRYTYRVTLLDQGGWSDPLYGGQREASLQVWPSTGTCEAPPDAVISNEGGCGCRTGLGAAWPHVVVLLLLGLGAVVGRRRRQGQPGSEGSGTAKQ